MKRRSFLAAVGLAPVTTAVTLAKEKPVLSDLKNLGREIVTILDATKRLAQHRTDLFVSGAQFE